MIPILPVLRPHDYFNIGDEVVVFLDCKWYHGKVEHGYRHHDGRVSYKLEGIGPQGNEDDFNGFWGAGMLAPSVLLLEDYLYFYDHPKEYVEWWDCLSHNTAYIDVYKKADFIPINDESISMFAKSLLKSCS